MGRGSGRGREELNVNSQEEVFFFERRNSITTCDVSQRSPVRPSDKKRMDVIMSHWRGRDSSVYMATSYGLEVGGSNPGGGEIFCARPDQL